MKYRHFVLTILLFFDFGSLFASEKSSNFIIVDPVMGTVDGVSYRGSIDTLKQQIDETRITEAIEALEGQPHAVHIIDFDGHKLFKHWNAISFTDPIFKLKESNLGVGSPVRMFDEYYGKGELDFYYFHWRSEDPRYHFSLFLEVDWKDANATYELDQKPKEIWVW